MKFKEFGVQTGPKEVAVLGRQGLVLWCIVAATGNWLGHCWCCQKFDTEV